MCLICLVLTGKKERKAELPRVPFNQHAIIPLSQSLQSGGQHWDEQASNIFLAWDGQHPHRIALHDTANYFNARRRCKDPDRQDTPLPD
jgi:hypothetical protein